MKLIILFITIILSSKSFSEPINDINFVDGKYFAYIDDNSLRWEIIIIKEKNELKIEFLDVKKGKFDYEGLQVFIPKTELTNKLSSQEIDNTMGYGLQGIRFYGTLNVNIYGTLGESSRLSWKHSSYLHSADFKYIPYKFYKTFKEELKKDRQLTTNIFLEKFIHN